MSPILSFERRQSLFLIVAPHIKDILVRITVAGTLQTHTSIKHTLQEAKKNIMVGGASFFEKVKKEVYKIQWVRWILRKLLLRWLFKRLVPSTTDDIVTLEPIKKPIHIVDWKRRHIYSFEEKTLHSSVTQTLLHSHGMFASPLRPKNPLTNLPLSLGQIISVWNGFSYATFPLSSTITYYRTVHFNHGRFVEEYWSVLSLYSIKRCIMNPLDIDGADCLFDFIEDVYEYNCIHFHSILRNRIYTAVYSQKDYPFLRQFRRRCVEYNQILLTKKNNGAVELLQEVYSIYRSCMSIIRQGL
jgi:hypothetical protein